MARRRRQKAQRTPGRNHGADRAVQVRVRHGGRGQLAHGRQVRARNLPRQEWSQNRLERQAVDQRGDRSRSRPAPLRRIARSCQRRGAWQSCGAKSVHLGNWCDRPGSRLLSILFEIVNEQTQTRRMSALTGTKSVRREHATRTRAQAQGSIISHLHGPPVSITNHFLRAIVTRRGQSTGKSCGSLMVGHRIPREAADAPAKQWLDGSLATNKRPHQRYHSAYTPRYMTTSINARRD